MLPWDWRCHSQNFAKEATPKSHGKLAHTKSSGHIEISVGEADSSSRWASTKGHNCV